MDLWTQILTTAVRSKIRAKRLSMKIRKATLICLISICIAAAGPNGAEAQRIKPGSLALFKVESLNTAYLAGGDVLVLALYINNSNGIPGPLWGVRWIVLSAENGRRSATLICVKDTWTTPYRCAM